VILLRDHTFGVYPWGTPFGDLTFWTLLATPHLIVPSWSVLFGVSVGEPFFDAHCGTSENTPIGYPTETSVR
jgi:hypothetical protein